MLWWEGLDLPTFGAGSALPGPLPSHRAASDRLRPLGAEARRDQP